MVFNEKLKLCPFCGGKPYAVSSGSCGGVIRCGDCSARTVSDFGIRNAYEEWNKRIKPEKK